MTCDSPFSSVADPGSGAFLTPGSGIRDGLNQDPDISESLEKYFQSRGGHHCCERLKILKIFDADPGSGIFLTLDPGWKRFGSGINIPYQQHCPVETCIV